MCKKDKAVGEFTRTPSKLQSYCRQCRTIYRRAQMRRSRNDVLRHYGGNPPCCGCCGEARYEFLALDHYQYNAAAGQSGRIHRMAAVGRQRPGSNAFYSWIIKSGFPVGFRVLCHNCNLASGFYRVCPHERERGTAEAPAHPMENG